MVNKFYCAGVSALKKNFLLVILLVTALGLAVALGQPLRRLPNFVDWNTIVTLSALLLITTGIKESGLFFLAAYRISRRMDNERLLALLLIFMSALLSMFLTNDVALFIIVPLTLSLQQIADTDYSKIIVFEAIGANIGSSLTPIGNPQNIFLWHQWGISFLHFIEKMAPLVLSMSLWLFVFTVFSFAPKHLTCTNQRHAVVDRSLFYLAAVLLIAFIAAVEMHWERYLLGIAFFSLAWMRKKVLFKTDWGLIFLFIVIFININLICQFEAAQHALAHLDFDNPRKLLLSGAFMSQAISNVPTAILLTNYSSNFKMIAYGVNIGGNGLLIGSFANLIALRFIKKQFKYCLLHAYSLSYFTITLISIYYFLI
jgi:Na+/H+ antiporter NhaD/arsenite permease-like protein